MKTPSHKIVLRNLLFFLPLIILLIMVNYLLCKHQWFTESSEEYLWGIITQTQREFNTKLFLIILGGCMIFYFLLSLIPLNSQIDKKSYIRRIEWQFLILCIILYFTGLFTPLYSTEKLKIFDDQVSLWNSIGLLMEYDEIYLGIIVFIFTILFPVTKFCSLTIEFIYPGFNKSKLFRIMSQFGKFSMLDVFIVAVLLLNIQFKSVLTDMKLEEGIVFFSLSVILSIILFSFRNEKFSYSSL